LNNRIDFWLTLAGLAFNWGALLGWAAMKGSCDWSVVLPLYAGGCCWTMVYDTIYAFQVSLSLSHLHADFLKVAQDREDDLRVGVKSTAIRFQDHPKLWLATFSAGSVSFISLAGYMNHQSLLFQGVLWGVGGLGLYRQLVKAKLDQREDCNRWFNWNKWFGLTVATAIVLDGLYHFSTLQTEPILSPLGEIN
jgi:4-hydroxybenzoate polyprenyltransferase